MIDGRNRLRACKIANVEPRFEITEFASDEAIRAFIRSKSERRHITAGQQAFGRTNRRSVPSGGRFVHHRQGLIEREGVRLLDGREILEGRRPMRRERLLGVQNGEVLDYPLVICVGRLVRALVRIGAEIEP